MLQLDVETALTRFKLVPLLVIWLFSCWTPDVELLGRLIADPESWDWDSSELIWESPVAALVWDALVVDLVWDAFVADLFWDAPVVALIRYAPVVLLVISNWSSAMILPDRVRRGDQVSLSRLFPDILVTLHLLGI